MIWIACLRFGFFLVLNLHESSSRDGENDLIPGDVSLLPLLPPFCTQLQSPLFLVRNRLAENVQVLVSDFVEIKLRTSPSFSSCLRFPLAFDYVFSKHESGIKKFLENTIRNRNVMLVLSGVTNQNGTMFTGLEDPIAFISDLLNCLKKVTQFS